VSIDGIDCRIDEHRPLEKGYYSHKFRHSGLRYEIGMALGCSRIVWINGGVSCGANSDLVLARSAFIENLSSGEMACAGYKDGSTYFVTPFPKNTTDMEERRFNRVHSLIMSRHENVNSRIRSFSAVTQQSRHCRHHGDDSHLMLFGAVCRIVQLLMEKEPVQEIEMM
jgi:hypothetical protein